MKFNQFNYVYMIEDANGKDQKYFKMLSNGTTKNVHPIEYNEFKKLVNEFRDQVLRIKKQKQEIMTKRFERNL